jgi:hypothetical protein
MSRLQNLAGNNILKKAQRPNINVILTADELVGALGPNRTTRLRTIGLLLEFLDLYVADKKALEAYINAQKLPPGVRLFTASKEEKNARNKRMNAAHKVVQNISTRARRIRNNLGLHLYRNQIPFNQSTLLNALGRLSGLRMEVPNRGKLYRNLNALYKRNS